MDLFPKQVLEIKKQKIYYLIGFGRAPATWLLPLFIDKKSYYW